MRYFAFALLAIAVAAVVRAENPVKCVPGESLASYCNECICNPDGASKSCSRKLCPEGVYNEDGSLKNPNIFFVDFSSRDKREANQTVVGNCEPHKLFHKYCNTCICTADGNNATCTNLECPEGVYNEDGTRKPGKKICEPFSEFKINCDDCYCSGSGTRAMCTDHNCESVPCEAGKVTRQGCDECTCDKTGTRTTCIKKFCPVPQNQDD